MILIKCFPSLLSHTLLRICHEGAYVPPLLFSAPRVFSPRPPPGFWSVSHSQFEFSIFRAPFSAGRRSWFCYDCSSLWLTAITSCKSSKYANSYTFQPFITSCGAEHSDELGLSKLRKRSFCDFWSWKRLRNFLFNPPSFGPWLQMVYFSIKNAISLKLLSTLVIQFLEVMGVLLHENFRLHFVFALQNVPGKSRFSMAYSKIFFALSAHSSMAFSSSPKK